MTLVRAGLSSQEPGLLLTKVDNLLPSVTAEFLALGLVSPISRSFPFHPFLDWFLSSAPASPRPCELLPKSCPWWLVGFGFCL